MKRRNYEKVEQSLQAKRAQVDAAIKANDQHTVGMFLSSSGPHAYRGVVDRKNEMTSWLLSMGPLELQRRQDRAMGRLVQLRLEFVMYERKIIHPFLACGYSGLFVGALPWKRVSPVCRVLIDSSLIRRLKALNLGKPASRMSWKARLSLVSMRTPSARRRSKANGTSKELQEETPSATTRTL